jgi:hypothetical protein
LCHLGLPNKFQYSKDQPNPFWCRNMYIANISSILFNLHNPYLQHRC